MTYKKCSTCQTQTNKDNVTFIDDGVAKYGMRWYNCNNCDSTLVSKESN